MLNQEQLFNAKIAQLVKRISHQNKVIQELNMLLTTKGELKYMAQITALEKRI